MLHRGPSGDNTIFSPKQRRRAALGITGRIPTADRTRPNFHCLSPLRAM
jgi:hypothetical protein